MRLYVWKNIKEQGWPYTRTHTMRLIKAGKCPAPADAHGTIIFWDGDEWDAYLRERFAKREASAVRRTEKAERQGMLEKKSPRSKGKAKTTASKATSEGGAPAEV